jgi:predicted nucleotidyltransferase
MATFIAKDFIKTSENLYFAVVKTGTEDGNVLVCLRYIYENGIWKKFDTSTGQKFLQQHYPQYIYHSDLLDTQVHGVAIQNIVAHYQPRERLQKLLQDSPKDTVLTDLIALCQLFSANGLDVMQIGITGSLLIGSQNNLSDIDLVFYQRDNFNQARQLTGKLIAENKLHSLNHTQWQQTFSRRNCELSFDDYLWHEQRKNNKVLINGRKVDLTLSQLAIDSKNYSKQGKITLTTKISDDSYSFDYPAKFLIDHPQINAIICFTATYSGQAQTGEWVEVSGQLEKTDDGYQQIIIGSDREAKGEFIRVIHS